MKTLKIALAAAVGSLALAGVAQAQDSSPTFAFNVGANTDYVFRGFSQSDEDPSIFGGVDATLGMGYAGVWVSTVDFGNGTDAEFDLYAGVKPTVGPVSFDLGVIYYGYVDQPSNSNEDYWEGKIAASVPAGPATIGAAVYYSPEFFGKTGEAWYYEANAAIAIPDTKFSISGAVGRQEIEKFPDYTTWNVGAGYAVSDKVSLDVRYWDTNLSDAVSGGLADSRVVGGLKVVF
ncbi:MAG TPA: TorF family putative porin [Phenylobacterium sp.]